jgi:hypothetical protein
VTAIKAAHHEQLSTKKRAQIIAALVEGNSVRATVRLTDVAKNTA